MSLGKMNQFIEIISTTPARDAEGFAVAGDTVVANVRAYKEDRHGSEKWANMAAFSTATALFRFRRIPGLEIDTSLCIVCGGNRYRIVSVEDIRNKGMYIEALAEKIEGSVR